MLGIAASTALLVGCGGSRASVGTLGSVPPSNSHGHKSTTQSAGRLTTTVHYVYVTSYGSHDVSVYAINAASGALTQVKGSPFLARHGRATLVKRRLNKTVRLDWGINQRVAQAVLEHAPFPLAVRQVFGARDACRDKCSV